MEWHGLALSPSGKAARARGEGLSAPEVTSGMSNQKVSEVELPKYKDESGDPETGWEKSYPKGRGLEARAERWNFSSFFVIFSCCDVKTIS